MKNTIAGKLAGGAATLGVLGVIYSRMSKNRTSQPSEISTDMRKTDMNILSRECTDALGKKRAECLENITGKAERQIAAILFDLEENVLKLIESIRLEAGISGSMQGESVFVKILNSVFGRAVSFVLAAAAFAVLIKLKWDMEQTADFEAAKTLNPAIIISAAAALHLMLALVYGLVRNLQGRQKKTAVSIKCSIPQSELDAFAETQLRLISKDTHQIKSAYAAPLELDNPALRTISEAYSEMYCASKTEDMTNINGYAIPKCAVALKQMDVEITEDYSAENSYLFDVIDAPDFEKSMVTRPVLRLKKSGELLSRGEYIDNKAV